MRWKGERPLTREQVEESVGTTGGFTIPTWRQRGGLVWIVLVLVLVALVLSGGLPGRGNKGVNLRRVLAPLPVAPAAEGRSFGPPGAPRFAARVSHDVDRTWQELFRRAGIAYDPPKWVVFRKSGTTDCGVTRGATQAYYCEYDQRLALGDRASPFLIAHAYAHHVQELLGVTTQIRRAERASPAQAKDFWRRHELQADCLAGVWAHTAYRQVGPSATPVASKPDHFVDPAHWGVATPEQRATWFRTGFESGNATECDTFSRDA